MKTGDLNVEGYRTAIRAGDIRGALKLFKSALEKMNIEDDVEKPMADYRVHELE